MHPSSSILQTLQRVKSYVATNLSSPALKVASIFEDKCQKLLGFLFLKLVILSNRVTQFVTHSFWLLAFQSNPFVVQIIYFMSISFVGFLALKNLSQHGKPVLRDLDLMFMSVSTATVSSMSTIQMEDLSDRQLWVLILLMLLGGEIFTSMLGLHFDNAKAKKEELTLAQRDLHSVGCGIESRISENRIDQIDMECGRSEIAVSDNQVQQTKNTRYSSRSILARIVTGYFLAGVVCSSVVIIIYFLLKPDARQVLKSREIRVCTFSIFTAVSSFANCGFTPLNRNMQDFRKNPILLLLVISPILAGNSMFPPFLWLSVWALGKVSGKQDYTHILQYPEESGCKILSTQRNSVHIFLTVTGQILLQVIFVCSFEWDSKAFEAMNWFQKLVGSLFQSVNTRQAGEAVVDISTFSSPVLLLFAIVMYLPSNISYLQIDGDDRQPLADKNPRRGGKWKNFTITSLACVTLFTFLACITERKSMSANPLNFNIFSIVFEVISAFGNVGYSLGYSCKKLTKPDANCRDASYGFVGWWTDEGKMIIILVMFTGRLKKFIVKEEKMDSPRTSQHQVVEAAR